MDEVIFAVMCERDLTYGQACGFIRGFLLHWGDLTYIEGE